MPIDDKTQARAKKQRRLSRHDATNRFKDFAISISDQRFIQLNDVARTDR
ncbi:hypothetical protein SynBIOSE41_00754 [Synechococcus sp. BIOS-E4-1]|nr:hypothetical protein SynBIOSE41_00754 [Synechococcus sp. BIOS-E4-1]